MNRWFAPLAVSCAWVMSCGSDDGGTQPPAATADAAVDVADAGDAPSPEAAGPDAGPSVPVGVVVIPPGYDSSEQGVAPVVDAALESKVALLSFGYAAWSSIEKQPGVFDFAEFDGMLSAVEGHSFGYALDVSTPIVPTGLDLPGDLTFSSFDDPTLLDRYGAFLRATAQFAPADTRFLTLHVEGATEYFAEHPGERTGFCTFMSKAVDTVRTARPDLRVGVYWRYEDTDDDLRVCVSGAADYLGLAFVLNPPGDAIADVPNILDDYLSRIGSQPLAIVEAGWPSAERFSSSEEIQTEFVTALFEAVTERRDRLLFVSYYTVFDEDRQVATAWVEAGFPDMPPETQQALIDWVCSLGLLRADGSEKPSWQAFVQSVAASL